MRTFVIINPHAGSGRTGRRWPDIAGSLSDKIGPFDHAFTIGHGHATTLARKAMEAGAELIIAVGGDGTISEAVKGFGDDEGGIRPGCGFAAISAGTGADFVRSLGSSPDPVRDIASGRRRRIASS